MKKYVILSVIMVFALTGLFLTQDYAYAQDCGKCPFKAKCLKEKATKNQMTDETPVVVIEKEKKFHKQDCKVVADLKEPTLLKLEVAKKKGFEPCTECLPELQEKKIEDQTVKEEKKEEEKK